MVRTVSATLFYGYVWPVDDDPGPHNRFLDTDWEEVLLEKRGHKNPWLDYPSGGDQEERRLWVIENEKTLGEWGDLRDIVAKEYGVVVGRHGYDFSGMYIAVEGSVVGVEAGEFELLDSMNTRIEDNLALDRWFEDLGVEKPGPVGWHLVASYS